MSPKDKKKSIKKNPITKINGKAGQKPTNGIINPLVDQSGYMSMLSHEIRTPLATICSSADLIQILNKNERTKNKKISDPGIKEHAVKIRNSAHRIIELLDNIITVNRAESGKLGYSPENLEIELFINGIICKAEMNSPITREIESEFELEDNFCFADRKLLDLIFSNLISNAIKFSGDKSKIKINVKLYNSIINFEITDNGIGIPEPDKSKLFEPFFRCNNAGNISGNGLGMFIVKKAVELHNGKICFESNLNIGTTFSVQIPAGGDSKIKRIHFDKK